MRKKTERKMHIFNWIESHLVQTNKEYLITLEMMNN